MARDFLRLPVAFESIMERHQREIMRYLLRATGHREDAADLFQETWLRAYRAYPRLRPEHDMRPWLYAIAVNLCRNRARDGVRRSRIIVAEGGTNGATNRLGRLRVLNEESDGYAAAHMRELIVALPAKQREAFQLRYFAGLDYAAIAAAMNCSQQNARANVSQAARRVKSLW